MSSGKRKVVGDREESCWRLRVQERREKGEKNREERILYALKRGGKTKSNREEKRGKKNREKT